MKRTAAGFTLIEVMIAITIMGVLALICWRALDSVASSDQRLRRADAETTTALRVLQQFQRDIEMRADDALMNGAVRPADQPQRLLPPFTGEANGIRMAALRWRSPAASTVMGCAGSGCAGGGKATRYGAPAVRRRTAIPCPHRFLGRHCSGKGCAAFRVRAWQPGAGWAMLPNEGEVLPATGLELRLGLRDGRGPLGYRRVLEL